MASTESKEQAIKEQSQTEESHKEVTENGTASPASASEDTSSLNSTNTAEPAKTPKKSPQKKKSSIKEEEKVVNTLKAQNIELRKQVKKDVDARKKKFANDTVPNVNNELKAYATLPVDEYYMTAEPDYDRGWDYKCRVLATGPQDEALNVKAENDPGEFTKTKRTGKSSTRSSTNPNKSKSRNSSKKNSEQSPKDNLPPQSQYLLWLKDNQTKILNAFTLKDTQCTGLLGRDSLLSTLIEEGAPVDKSVVEETLPDEIQIDYNKWLQKNKTVALSEENKLRGGTKTTVLHLPKVSAKSSETNDLSSIRSEIAKSQAEIRKKKEEEEYAATKAMISKLKIDQLRNQNAKNLIATACVTYSPSKKATKKALKESDLLVKKKPASVE